MRTGLIAFLVIDLLVVAVVGVVLASTWTPTVPVGAAGNTIARAAPGNQECLPRITRQGGWLDLCWEAYQIEDGDPEKDYYGLRVYGTASGEGSGIRWWRVRANLAPDAAQTPDAVFEGWPSGLYDGACREEPVHAIGTVTPAFETICGRTIGEFVGVWGHQVTWTCVGCLLGADHSTRSVVLHESVGVATGSMPAWDVGADLGD